MPEAQDLRPKCRGAAFGAQDDILRTLWKTHTAQEIADILGRSKGSVAVRGHKLGLLKTAPRNYVKRAKAPEPAPVSNIIRLPMTIVRKTSPAPYQPRTCQFMHGEPRERNFCGAPVMTGKSYCPEHQGVCYVTQGVPDELP